MKLLVLFTMLAACSGNVSIDVSGLAPLDATAPASLAPLGKGLMKATGGSPPYVFAFDSNPPASGADAQLDVASGEFRLGSIGRAHEVLRVTDKRDETVTVNVDVGEALALDPPRAVVDPSGLVDFDAFGGQPPYKFHIEGVTEDRIDEDTGIFVAGTDGGRLAKVIVTDANDAQTRAEAQITLDFTAGATPVDVALLDANHDGILDMAVAPSSGGSVVLLAGDGRGSFAPLGEIPLGAFPRAITSADLNGDHLTDLLVTTTSPDQLIVLLQDPGAIGGFREATRQPVAALPVDVTLIPLANAAFAVITAADSGHAVDITRLHVAGMQVTLLSTTRIAVPGRATRLAIGDFLGDASIDLAVGVTRPQPSKSSVMLFAGNGSGQFPATASHEVMVGEGLVALGAGQLGGGGKDDLAVSSSLTNELGLIVDNASGVPTLLQFPITGGDGSQCAPCGRTEDAACGGAGQCIMMRPTDETQVCALACQSNTDCPNATDCQELAGGRFCAPQLNRCPVSSMLSTDLNPRAVRVVDLDLDGIPEIVVTLVADLDVFRADGSRRYHKAYRAATGANPRELDVGDVNSDTFPDVVTANGDAQNVSVLLGLGRLFTQIGQHSVGAQPGLISIGELDHDPQGANDIVVETGTSMLTLLGDGHGDFVPYRQLPFYSPTSPRLADIDGDGYLDLLAFHGLARTLEFVPWDVGVGFTGGPEASTGVQPVSLALADIDRDGHLDAVIANQLGERNVAVLWGRDGGVFTPYALDSVMFSYQDAALQPFDVAAIPEPDGSLDHFIVQARGSGNTQLDSVSVGADGHGTSTWSQTVTAATGLTPVVLDCNGDGLPDFAQLYVGVTNNAFDGRVWRATANGYESAFDLHTGLPVAGSPGAFTASGPDSIVATDVDGDGKIDLVASTRLDKQLVVFTGRGDCTFTIAGRVHTGHALSGGMSSADFDGDGLPDLACSMQPDELVVFQNMGVRSGELRSFPLAGRLCDACTSDAECGGDADLCADHVGMRTLCSRDCSGGKACPAGFACQDVQGAKQCLHTGDQCVN